MKRVRSITKTVGSTKIKTKKRTAKSSSAVSYTKKSDWSPTKSAVKKSRKIKRLKGGSVLAEDRSSYKVEKKDGGVLYPKVDSFYHVRDEQKKVLDIVNKMSSVSPTNIMLTGPQGGGKSELAVWFAAKYGRPLIILNCASIREARDWFGFKNVEDGTIVWKRSEFVRALTTPNCVILFDEFNRLHPSVHNTLYPVLDARRSTFIEELGETVDVSPGVVFFATANIGAGHTGTFAMDSAIEDRWTMRLNITFLDESSERQVLTNRTGVSEELAKKLCRFARDVRTKASGLDASLSRSVSTRQLIATAKMMTFMDKTDDIKSAFDYTVLPYFSSDGGKDSEQAQVLQLVQGIFGT